MKYKIVANISLQSGESGYRFTSFELEIQGSAVITFDKLFERVAEKAREKFKDDFKNVTNIRVVQVEENENELLAKKK